jgi:putative oxidoreductase
VAQDAIDEPVTRLDRPAVDVALLILRAIAGVIFAAHGAQKLFGLWDGPGLQAMVADPPNGMGRGS